MLNALLNVILPVVLVAAVGAVLSRRFVLDQGTLAKVQLYGLTPALAFSSLMKTTVSAHDVGRLAAGYALVTVVSGIAATLIAVRMPPGTRRAMVACTLIGNNGNFGLPIALLALGQAGLDQAVVIFLFSLVVMWTVGPATLGGHTRPLAVLGAMARLPVTWALLIAVLLHGLGVTPPVGVMSAVDLIAAATVPMVLLSLGIQLGSSKRVHVSAPVVVTVALRVLLVPAVAYAVAHLLGIGGVAGQSLILACAMPTAVNTLMLATEYGADADLVASVVALSTLLSIATLAVVIANLGALA